MKAADLPIRGLSALSADGGLAFTCFTWFCAALALLSLAAIFFCSFFRLSYSSCFSSCSLRLSSLISSLLLLLLAVAFMRLALIPF